MEFKKYPKIKRIGDEENKDIFTNPEDEIIVQEKVDGANFRILIHEGKLIFGSRTQQITSDSGEDTDLQKNFIRCVNFIRDTLKDIDLSIFNNLIIYGECMVRHTISYDWDRVPPFLGFDIYNLETNEYCGYDDCVQMFDMLRLPMVPLVGTCRAKDIKEINDDMVPISKYSLHSAEGLVFKNYSKQLFAKYVRNEFKEKNHKVFGGGKKFATNDEEYLVSVYCPNARIDKAIFKLLDEGNTLDMALMHKLPNFVYNDIWEENWDEIKDLKQKTINFGKLKGLVSKRCLEVLNQVLTNNALNS
jgi:ATP-dependent RNA circularization protein (DNA/RNA ligase family)